MENAIGPRLRSRKWWAAIATGIVLVFGENLGIHLDSDQLWGLAVTAASYLGGQGLVDAVKANRP